MSAIDDGGPALPIVCNEGEPSENGMSLRDYFAAKAMHGFCVSYPYWSYLELARAAYAMADAMLEARK